MKPVNITRAKTSCLRCGSTLGALSEGTLCPVCLLAACLEAEEAREGTDLGTGDEAVADGLAQDWGGEAQAPIGRMGDFELLEEIGRGAMGVVYRARQVSLDRVVAVKVLLAGPLASLEAIERFRIEALAAGGLHHPGIVAIHEAGTHEGRHYLVMDYVAGRSLAEVISDLRLEVSNPQRSAHWVKAIAEAVHHAHEHGVLHRDLKPSNVLIDADDQPRVTDFGLAKRLGTDSHLTMSGEVVGSPGYLPPEQAGGRRGRVNRASDVYSLGAMLYHLLTGRAPFVGEGTADVIHQVLDEEPVRPRLVNPKVPRDLETICLKCLEKEPGRRYATARELAEELGRYLNDEPIRARPVSAVGRLWRWCHRNPALAAALGACVMLLLSGVVGVVTQWRRAEAESQRQRRFAYEADMNLVPEEIAMDNLGRAEQLLDRHRPRRGQADLRGWEWRMLQGLVLPDSLRTVGRHEGEVKALGFAGNGRLITGSFDEARIAVWYLASGDLMEEIRPAGVFDIAVHPSGRIFAVAAFAAEVDLYTLDPLQQVAKLPARSHQATVRFSPDGSHLAALSAEHLDLWALSWGPDQGLTAAELVVELPVSSFWPIAFSADGKLLAYRNNDRVVLYSLPERQTSTLPPLGVDVAGLAFAPDEHVLAAAGFDGKVVLVDLQQDQVTLLRQYEQPLRVVAFSRDGSALVVAGVSGLVHVWDVRPLRERSTLVGHAELVSSMEFSPDGRFLATGSKDSTCQIWDINRVPNRSRWVQDAPCRAVLGKSANGRFLLAREDEAEMSLWDLREGRRSKRFKNPYLRTALAASLNSSGSKAIIACSNRALIQLDFEQPDVPTVLPITNKVSALACSHDGNLFAIATEIQQIRVYNSSTAQPKSVLAVPPELPPGEVGHLAFGENDRILFAGIGVYLVRFNVESGRPTATPRFAHRRPFGIWLAPKGDVLATLATDNRLRIWDSKSLAPVVTGLPCYGDWGSVAFDAAGERVFVTARASRVAVFDTVRATQLALLEPRLSDITHLQFCTESDTLAIFGRRAGILQLWRAPSLAEIEIARDQRSYLALHSE